MNPPSAPPTAMPTAMPTSKTGSLPLQAPSSALKLPSGTPHAARLVLGLLKRLRSGHLEVQLPDGSVQHFGPGCAGQPRAQLQLANWNLFGAAIKSGDIGLAETHVAGDWTSPDTVALLRLFIANRDALEELVYGRWWGRALHRVRHLLNRNSRTGSRRNIHAHYDLGNAFYRLWLDDSWAYSSAWFNGDFAQPMVQAQQAKMRRALAQCGVRPGQRLLEIGCGWGALAECAARDFGAHVMGVTLSTEQLALAEQRIADAGLADRVDLRLCDYRDIEKSEGQYSFDAIVSIEMFEAVGREYWPGFFRTLREQLKPGGKACLQSITIRDDLFDRYVQGTDFIQQYIFPGGLLPSRSEFRAEAARAGLRVVDEMPFGADYAETLRRWRTAFHEQGAQVRALGFDTRFMRLWDFYLAYCEAAFDSGCTDVVQFTLEHP